ncbi:MAG TPA: FHA domain-containing protein [Clostridiales bacterium]|nr:FHA domain-containing protein [Clostridiales bacterium]
MKVEYKRELRNSYMVLSHIEEEPYESYSIKMLSTQSIEGILPLDLRLINNQKYLYYEISGKQLMINLFDKVELTYDRVKNIISKIINTIERTYEYLLSPDDLMISDEYIFLDLEKANPCLCYLPGYNKNIKEQMGAFIEFLMDKVDYKDKEAVLLVYQLYAVCKEEGYTFEHLQELIYDNNRQSKNIDKSVKESRFQVEFDDTYEALVKENHKIKKRIMDIPIMMEKLEGEEEVLCYPYKTYILSAVSVIIGLLIIILASRLKLFYNQYGDKIDYLKLFILIVMVLSVEGYIMKSLLDKKNHITKMVVKKEYVDPRINYDNRDNESKKQENPTELAKKNKGINYGHSRNINNEKDEEYNPTCLIEDFYSLDENISYGLIPIDSDEYSKIKILEFPFFVGKGMENVDYCLENDLVSRYHAKILKEEDQFFLIDLNSTNGSFINGEKLLAYKRNPLNIGDEIALANIKFKFAFI